MRTGIHSAIMALAQGMGSTAFANPVASLDLTNVKLEALAIAITGLSEMFKTILQNQ